MNISYVWNYTLESKKKFVKDKKDDPEVQKVYQTLKQKSLIQNRIIRTVDAVYMRLQNLNMLIPDGT